MNGVFERRDDTLPKTQFIRWRMSRILIADDRDDVLEALRILLKGNRVNSVAHAVESA